MRRFNIIAGTSVIPLLARLILCAAFLTAGWTKLMHHQQFEGEAAERLIELGIADVVSRRADVGPIGVSALLTAYHAETARGQDAADRDVQQDRDAAPDETFSDEVERLEITEHLEPPPDVVVEDAATGEQTLYAKRLHGVTLALLDRQFEGAWAIRLAWLLAITELVAGALLLLGLFSRIWGVALAVVMTVAFYFTSLDTLVQHGGPFGLAGDMTAFNRTYTQLGLLVLALTVALVGPGPLSLDRLIFRPAKVEIDDEFV